MQECVIELKYFFKENENDFTGFSCAIVCAALQKHVEIGAVRAATFGMSSRMAFSNIIFVCP